jgi:hypothetical protein
MAQKTVMFTFEDKQLDAIINELYFIENTVVDSVAKLDIKGDIFYKRKCKYLNQLRNKLEIVKNDKSSL